LFPPLLRRSPHYCPHCRSGTGTASASSQFLPKNRRRYIKSHTRLYSSSDWPIPRVLIHLFTSYLPYLIPTIYPVAVPHRYWYFFFVQETKHCWICLVGPKVRYVFFFFSTKVANVYWWKIFVYFCIVVGSYVDFPNTVPVAINTLFD
jgi:hypothetical protein